MAKTSETARKHYVELTERAASILEEIEALQRRRNDLLNKRVSFIKKTAEVENLTTVDVSDDFYDALVEAGLL